MTCPEPTTTTTVVEETTTTTEPPPVETTTTTAPEPTTTTTPPEPTTTTTTLPGDARLDLATAANLIVKLVTGLSVEAEQAAVIESHGGVETSAVAVLRLHMVAVAPDTVDESIAEFLADPAVVSVDLDRPREAESAPSDPGYGDQWALPLIGFEDVFGVVTPSGSARPWPSSTPVSMAVTPTWPAAWSAGGPSMEPTRAPIANGHGTQVATIAAAGVDDGVGIAGVGYAGVSIMPVRVLGDDGTGNDSDIIEGLVYAVQNGADVVVMAFSNPGESAALQFAVNYAWANGVVLVAAAGNDGSTRSDLSGRPGQGRRRRRHESVGQRLGRAATRATPSSWSRRASSIASSSGTVTGTSASAAMVAGAAAVMLANDSAASPPMIVGRLARNAEAVDGVSGNGRLHLGRSLVDESTIGVTPVGAPGGGGPIVGPYVVAARTYQFETNSVLISNDEGDTGTTPFTFTVGGNGGGTTRPHLITWATTNGTATGGAACLPGIDYVSAAGTLSFATGEDGTKTIVISVCGDTANEVNETFTVRLLTALPTGGQGANLNGPRTVAQQEGSITTTLRMWRPRSTPAATTSAPRAMRWRSMPPPPDADGDTLTLAWTYTIDTADLGTTCAFSDDTIEDPTFSCTDDGTFTVTLTADDGVNPPVSDSATVTLSNADPEVTIDDPDDGDLFGTTDTVNLSASFSDDGTNDSHTCTIDWGDLTVEAGTVSETNGSGTCTGSHTYASGNWTITVTITDDDAGSGQDSVDIVVNDPPEVDAGGDYLGTEGNEVALDATATDADGDTLTLAWTYTIDTADLGTTCAFSDDTIEDPTFSCTDDGTFTVTLTADDGVNPPVSDSATVTLSNADPEVTIDDPDDGDLFGTTDTVNLSASFSDDGTNDSHTCTIDWGDLTVEAGTVSETNGSGTCTGSHTYASGNWTITVTITDDDAGSGQDSVDIVVNDPPEVDAGGDYLGTEGNEVALDATATDADGDTLTLAWTYTIDTADLGTTCAFSDDTIEDPTFSCTDDGTFTVTLTADDGVNPPVSDSATVTLSNADPEVTIDDPDDGDLFGTTDTVNLSASFSDDGTNDSHTCTIDWGDLTVEAGTVSETNGSGTCTGSHTYASGNWTITVTITDDDAGSGQDSVDIVVNDPPEVDAGGDY